MKNQTLNNAFPIVAAALGNKFGVNVKVGGKTAFTDGRTINLPAYNLEDPSYKDVAWGYLAHEAAHVRFTDFVEFTNAATNPLRKAIVNILEDIRIEKAMHDIYPGTRLTIQKLDEHLCQASDYQIVSQGSHPAAILTQYLFLRLSTDVLGYVSLASYAEQVETILEETFPVGAVTRLAGLLAEVPELQVTRDCVRLSDRILRMIEEEQEKAQESANLQQQTSESGQSECDGLSTPSDADSQNPGQNGPNDAGYGDSSQPETASGDDLQADVEADGSQSGQLTEPESVDQDQGKIRLLQPSNEDGANEYVHSRQESIQFAGNTDDQSQVVDHEQVAQVLASVLSAGENDVSENIFDTAQRVLGNQPRNCYDMDVHLPIAMQPSRNPAVGQALMKRVLNESGKIRTSLHGLVQASQRERPVTKHSGNRVDGRKLSRLMQGDSRLFGRKHHHRAPNTAIHLLVDGSFSMSDEVDPAKPGHRLIHLAMDAAVALALALEGISGVNPAITRFPWGDTDNVVSLLRHGQKVRLNASAFTAMTDGGTPLHTALWYAAAAVLATREERKIIMVLTDGQPDDVRAAKAIIDRCEATGIELVGIGICFDTTHLFKRSIVIKDVSGLRSELFRISRELLLAA